MLLNDINYNNLLNKKYNELKIASKKMMGFPVNNNFEYSNLTKFFEIAINNIGDPFFPNHFSLNTHDFELEIINFIAKLYHKNEDYWGYVTNGGSEGNLMALHIARMLYPEAIVYYSSQSHYSVKKAIEITRSKFKCIPSLDNGEINYQILQNEIVINQNLPAIVFANVGTTMTGATDNLKKINSILINNNIKDYYIHCDAALHGLILPFCSLNEIIHFNNFQSFSISGHKLFGSPIPCGIFLTHLSIIKNIREYIEYIKSGDCTLTGSRNGITSLILWSAIKQNGYKNLRKIAICCLQKAKYAKEKMKQTGINAWSNKNSPIVVFPKPSEQIIRKWILASNHNIAHIVAMPHVTYENIDQLIIDISVDKNDLY